jgi:hypothetical protein
MHSHLELTHKCANDQDSKIIASLFNAFLSSLPIDEFAAKFCRTADQSKESSICALRVAISRIYIQSASVRLNTKSTGKQLHSAESALMLMSRALSQLAQVEPFPLWGLHAVLAVPYEDPRGVLEPNAFNGACWQTKLDLMSTLMRLTEAIDREQPKLSLNGERKKRLRTLVEALADWWESTGRSIAPYVKAKRRDNAPAVMIGRFGDFVSFAIAVFCKLDGFSETEVVAAITNVHKARLATKKR